MERKLISNAIKTIYNFTGKDMVNDYSFEELGIKGLNVIKFIQSEDNYDDSMFMGFAINSYNKFKGLSLEEAREALSEDDFTNERFADMDMGFTKQDAYCEDNGVGVSLCIDYLSSSFCTDEERKSFMKELINIDPRIFKRIDKEYENRVRKEMKKIEEEIEKI